MRSLSFIVAGILLWLLMLAVAKWQQIPCKQITVMFAGIWFAVALLNMWLGVSGAGYSVAEEFPIFLLIFLVPAGLAGLFCWRLAAKSGV